MRSVVVVVDSDVIAIVIVIVIVIVVVVVVVVVVGDVLGDERRELAGSDGVIDQHMLDAPRDRARYFALERSRDREHRVLDTSRHRAA